jgi:hypothetical protein
MARSEGCASPKWAVTTERRRQLPFCFAPSTVALILAVACVARLAKMAADIGAAFRALANAKIHSNATHSSISTVSERKDQSNLLGILAEKIGKTSSRARECNTYQVQRNQEIVLPWCLCAINFELILFNI